MTIPTNGPDEALAARLRDAFPAAADPRDADLAQMIAAAGPAAVAENKIIPLRPRRARPALVWSGLVAASFAAGVVLGPILGSRDGGDLSVGKGGVITDAGLAAVLDRRLAAEGPDGEGRAIGLTFRDTAGRWCRTFEAQGAGVAGLACREGDGWALRALAPVSPASGGEMRMAGAETPAAILAAVDASLGGETLDAAAEARARDAGWRP